MEDLAKAAHLSPRQFSRAFREETGQTPAKAIEHLRVEAARLMLESGRHGVDVVARDTGFGDRERMRRAFLRAFAASRRRRYSAWCRASGAMAHSPVADSMAFGSFALLHDTRGVTRKPIHLSVHI